MIINHLYWYISDVHWFSITVYKYTSVYVWLSHDRISLLSVFDNLMIFEDIFSVIGLGNSEIVL